MKLRNKLGSKQYILLFTINPQGDDRCNQSQSSRYYTHTHISFQSREATKVLKIAPKIFNSDEKARIGRHQGFEREKQKRTPHS